MGKKVKKVLNMPESISDDSDDPDFDPPARQELQHDDRMEEVEPIAESSRTKFRRSEVLSQAEPRQKRRKKSHKPGFLFIVRTKITVFVKTL